MFPVTNKDNPAGSSSQHDTNELEGVVDSRKGGKPSLAERNRERQQRFRQRQKSRIEELESRCSRLTSETRTLLVEKGELARNVALLKNLVQVRDLQLVAVTSQLAQHLPPGGEIKTEIPALEGVPGGLDALLTQQPALALEALHSARRESQVDGVQLQSTPVEPQVHEGPSSTDTGSHEPLSGPARTGSPASGAQPPTSRPHSPQQALDQLCRVAEMAEMQRAESSSPPASCPPRASGHTGTTATLPLKILSHINAGFVETADAVIEAEGQRIAVHSSFLAAHSEMFAKVLRERKHSQPLFQSQNERLTLETGTSGKRIQDIMLFLSYCYGILNLAPVADTDIMRLIMLADEFGARGLLDVCDETIVMRAEGRTFSYFVELSQGGDVVDWIRLADRLGLKRVSGVCEMHLARYLKENRTWRENHRLNELGQECLLRVINRLAEL